MRKESGQAFIEFLIVFPPLFLIFMAVVFFGKGYAAKTNVDVAVRYAAWKNGRSPGAVDGKRLAELYFPGEVGRPAEENRLKLYDPGPPPLLGLEGLREINNVIDRLGRTEECGLQYRMEAPYFIKEGVGISSAHYVDIKAWDDRTSLAAIGLWGLGIVKGFASAKTTGLCYGGAVKVVITPFAKEILKKKADDFIEKALESGMEKVKEVVREKIEGWADRVRTVFSSEGEE